MVRVMNLPLLAFELDDGLLKVLRNLFWEDGFVENDSCNKASAFEIITKNNLDNLILRQFFKENFVWELRNVEIVD